MPTRRARSAVSHRCPARAGSRWPPRPGPPPVQRKPHHKPQRPPQLPCHLGKIRALRGVLRPAAAHQGHIRIQALELQGWDRARGGEGTWRTCEGKELRGMRQPPVMLNRAAGKNTRPLRRCGCHRSAACGGGGRPHLRRVLPRQLLPQGHRRTPARHHLGRQLQWHGGGRGGGFCWYLWCAAGLLPVPMRICQQSHAAQPPAAAEPGCALRAQPHVPATDCRRHRPRAPARSAAAGTEVRWSAGAAATSGCGQPTVATHMLATAPTGNSIRLTHKK